MQADASLRVRKLGRPMPICAQCEEEMTLVSIERRAFHPRTDKFVCAHCGLIDKIVWPNMLRAAAPQQS